MKKLAFTICLAALLSFGFNNQSHAQESFGNVGLEVGLPVGDWADYTGFGIGGSFGYELGISDNFAVGAHAGYTIFTGKEQEVGPITIETDARSTIPVQAYARYYLDESRQGLFLSAKVGVHINLYEGFDEEGNEETQSDSYFSAAPEVGFFLAENISLALRYQLQFATYEDVNDNFEVVEKTENFGYLGLRAAFNF